MSTTTTAPVTPTDAMQAFFLPSAPTTSQPDPSASLAASKATEPSTPTETPSGASAVATATTTDAPVEPTATTEKTDKSEKVDKTDKRLRDKDAYITKLTGKLRDLETQMTVLQKKLEGDYQEPVPPTPEQAAATARLQAKAELSRTMAIQTYGEDTVQTQVLAEDSPYRALEAAHPWVFHRVVASEHPVEEALTILKEQRLFEQWGRDPDKILEKAEALLRPKLMKEFAEAAKGMGIVPGKIVPGLSGVRGESTKATAPLAPGQSAFNLDTLSAIK